MDLYNDHENVIKDEGLRVKLDGSVQIMNNKGDKKNF